MDLFTIGLNAGTAMAFGALLGMPAIFAILGLLAGGAIAAGRHGVDVVLRLLRDS